MKTELQKQLALIAPHISIKTIWEHDKDAEWDCEGLGLDPDDFTAWQSEVRASAIIGGELVYGSAYLGGTWEKYGSHPSVSNPEISGYEPQMTQESLRELRLLCPADLQSEITDAINAVKGFKPVAVLPEIATK